MLMLKKRPNPFRLKSDELVYRWSLSNGYISSLHFLFLHSYVHLDAGKPHPDFHHDFQEDNH